MSNVHLVHFEPLLKFYIGKAMTVKHFFSYLKIRVSGYLIIASGSLIENLISLVSVFKLNT